MAERLPDEGAKMLSAAQGKFKAQDRLLPVSIDEKHGRGSTGAHMQFLQHPLLVLERKIGNAVAKFPASSRKFQQNEDFWSSGVKLKRALFMQRLLAIVGGIVLGTVAAAQADVLLLGGLEPVAPAAPVVYTQPVVYQAPPVFIQVPVYAQQETPVLCLPPPPCYGPSSDVIYVAGAGSCQQNYCLPRRCDPPNVIYFGRMQACREGYQFGHAR